MRIPIVYITDEKYILPTYVSILSVIKNKRREDNIVIYIVEVDVSEQSHIMMSELQTDNVEISFINVMNMGYEELAKKCLLSDIIHVSKAALYKMNLPELIECESKVLYLDGDTIIQYSLDKLYSYDISNLYVGAVDDLCDLVENGKSWLANRIGLNTKHYFNSGVMLLNLKLMREDNISSKLLEYRKNGINYYMDQDCFNYVLGSKRMNLPYTYNFMSTSTDNYEVDVVSEKFFGQVSDSIDECISQANILHLCGKMKCWEYNMPWYSEKFLQYYKLGSMQKKICLKSSIKELIAERRRIQRNIEHFVFPFNRIEKHARIVLYGAGNVGKAFYSQIKKTGYCEMILWVDKKYMNLLDMPQKIEAVESITEYEFDNIVVAIKNKDFANEIMEQLINLGVDTQKIVWEEPTVM